MAYIDGIKKKNTLYEIRDTKTASALNTLAEYGDAEIAIGSFVPGGINSNGEDINTSSQLTYSRRSKDFLPIETAPVIVHTKGGVTLYLRFFDDAGNILTNSENAAYISVGSSQAANVNVQYSKTVDMTEFNAAAVKYKIIFAVAQNAESLPNLTVDNIRLSAGHKLATAGELAAVADQNLPNVWGLFRNAVCIGDSLTRGYYSAYASGKRNRDYGYPNALAQLTGMNVWNFGLSGSNPDGWLADATLAQEDYSRFDAAFIAFGQNRSTQTDAEYQEMYLNVLARLKTANTNMVIFCLSNPGPKQNTDIQAIVNAATDSSGSYQYSYVYFLDISGGDYAAHRTDGTHLDAIGYSMLAESVKIAVEKLYISDPSAIYISQTKDNVVTDPVNPLGEAEERITGLEETVASLTNLEKNRGFTPAQLQAICASGHAPDYFDIGDIIYIDWTDYADANNPVTYHVPHVVVHFGDVEDQEGNIHRNGMYLQWMYGTPSNGSIAFDAKEQIVAEEAIFQSGYYYYTKDEEDVFTEQQVTAGTAIPSGTTYYKHYRSGVAQRLQFGSNDYSQSAYRQWLNSDADAGEWWTAQHPSDVAPSTAATRPGFLKGYSAEWRAIFKPSKVQFVKNSVVDNGEVAVMYDTFFLPSLEQVYGANSRNGVEGTYWEYWKEVTGLEAPTNGNSTNTVEARTIWRIDDLEGNRRQMRLRTCRNSDDRSTYVIHNGYITYQTAYNGYTTIPATVIY